MSGISTHVLDTTRGCAAAAVAVRLERDGVHVATMRTDADGRCKPLLAADDVRTGVYRLWFGVGDYFASLGVETLYPEVTISFHVKDAGAAYHVPLLLNPFGYTTYRGT